VISRFTDVDGIVLNTSCDMFAAGLNTPDRVIEKSASSRSRSNADLSMPVMSCTARGVANCTFVKSFLSACCAFAASSMESVVHPNPDVFAMI
jgi:hypothetical protein